MAEVSDSWELQMKESDQRFYRTMNELRVEMGLLPVNYSNSMEDQVYDQIILVKIHNLKYSISCRELNMVFSRFGALEKVETLSPRSQFHARICFQNIESARTAIDSLNHRNVYDYCCELELFLMRDIMIEPSNSQPTIKVDTPNVGNMCDTGIEGIQVSGNPDSSLQETHNKVDTQELGNFDSRMHETHETHNSEEYEEPEISSNSSKIASNLLTKPVDKSELKEMMLSNDALVVSMEIESELLVDMPNRELLALTAQFDKDSEELRAVPNTLEDLVIEFESTKLCGVVKSKLVEITTFMPQITDGAAELVGIHQKEPNQETKEHNDLASFFPSD